MFSTTPSLEMLSHPLWFNHPIVISATYLAQLSEVKKGMKRKKAEENAEDAKGWWHPFSLHPFFDGWKSTNFERILKQMQLQRLVPHLRRCKSCPSFFSKAVLKKCDIFWHLQRWFWQLVFLQAPRLKFGRHAKCICKARPWGNGFSRVCNGLLLKQTSHPSVLGRFQWQYPTRTNKRKWLQRLTRFCSSKKVWSNLRIFRFHFCRGTFLRLLSFCFVVSWQVSRGCVRCQPSKSALLSMATCWTGRESWE